MTESASLVSQVVAKGQRFAVVRAKPWSLVGGAKTYSDAKDAAEAAHMAGRPCVIVDSYLEEGDAGIIYWTSKVVF